MAQFYQVTKSSVLLWLIALTATLSIFITSCSDEDNPVVVDDGVESLSATLVDGTGSPMPETVVELYEQDAAIQADLTEQIGIDTTDSEGNFSFDIKGKSIDKLKIKVRHIFVDEDGYLNLSEYKAKIKNGELVSLKVKEKKECVMEVKATVSLDGQELDGDEKLEIVLEGKKLLKAKANEDGSYTLNICPGTYRFRIKMGDTVYSTVEEIGNDMTEISLELTEEEKESECCTGTVIIQFTDKEGNYLDGTQAWLRNLPEKKEFNKKIEIKDGKAVFEDVCEGEYEIRLAKEGYNVIEEKVSVACDDTKEYTFKMEMKESGEECCDNILSVTVKDKDGKPIQGAKVLLLKDGKGIEDPRTNSDGKAVIDGICKDNGYRLVVTAEGFTGYEANLEDFGCGEERSKSITLEKKKEEECCKGNLQVIVKDKDGNYVSNAEVWLRNLPENKELNIKKKTEQGKVFFEGICEGKYEIRIAIDGYKVQEVMVEIDCEKTTEKAITLEKTETEECCDNSLWLKVKDGEGKAIKGAKVYLKKAGKVIEDPLTNADGIIEIDGICKGDGYYVVIQAEGYDTKEMEIGSFGCGEGKEKVVEMSGKEKDCCNASLTVMVKDEDGNAIEGVAVILRRGGKAISDPRTNGDGIVNIEELCEGEGYSILVKKDGYGIYESENFGLDCDKNLEKSVKLKK